MQDESIENTGDYLVELDDYLKSAYMENIQSKVAKFVKQITHLI